MPIIENPNLPSPIDTMEDVLTIVTLLKSELRDSDHQLLLDQAALRLCYLLVNQDALTSDRRRQLLRLQISLSQRLRLRGANLHSLQS